MGNIIRSDLYRLRKGAAARNTIIGLLATVIFLGFSFYFMTSDGLKLYLDDSAASSSSDPLTEGDKAELSAAYDELQNIMPQTAADFGREMMSENILAFFLLPLIIAIFCADFTAGTHRNTLSYESSRTKVYMAKLALSALCCVALNVLLLAFSWIIGGFLFGFGGFTATYLIQTIVTLLLLLPIQLGVIGFGHLLVAFTKKSSITIAIYLLALTILSGVLQAVALLPALEWVSLLDWNMVGRLLASYWTMPAGDIVIATGAGLVIAAGSTALGLSHYRKADMV